MASGDGHCLSSLGFIGSGNMAFALAQGIITSGLIRADLVWASAPTNNNIYKFKDLGCNITTSNKEVVAHCNVVFLCVKPHLLCPVLQDLSSDLTPDHLLISVAAGITLPTIQKAVPHGVRVVRAMPNTPSLVGAGACGFFCGKEATAQDATLVSQLFSTIGICEELSSEALIDAVAGLSGSGPAYVYTVVQSLADGGVKMGLPRNLATKFAAQTVVGAGQMVLQTDKHPGQLRDEVCSPGGTTIAGVHALEAQGVRAAFIDAVQASATRCKELSK